MSWDWDYENSQFIFDEKQSIFDNATYVCDSECPQCGYKEANSVTIEEYGEWKDIFVCIQCGYEY